MLAFADFDVFIIVRLQVRHVISASYCVYNNIIMW